MRTLRSKSFQEFAGSIPEENEEEEKKGAEEGLEFMKKLEEPQVKRNEEEEEEEELTEEHKAEEDEIERGIALQQEGLQQVVRNLEEKEELLRTVQEEH